VGRPGWLVAAAVVGPLVPLGLPAPARVPALLAVGAALAGLVLGAWRVQAIDSGAYRGSVGSRATVTGHIEAIRRPLRGTARILLASGEGRLQVETPDSTSGLRVGQEIRATGTLRRPSPATAPHLARAGIRRTLSAGSLISTGGRRAGLRGVVDTIRTRAEAALERGMPAGEAALARGMVLGEDDRIDERTVERFRRSGLAHILAVSGQNVLLLVALCAPVLAMLGLGLKGRLVGLLLVIALYVPLTGASASIQRAAVMGMAGLAATASGRASDRWHSLALAAAVTLGINPRATGDPGWQLSFAAVAGIALWARPVASWLQRRIGDQAWARITAEGIAMSLAATVATGPLMAYDFERLSLTSPVANLAALPAVAPAMWLGMVVSALGQVPSIPVEPLNWVNSLLIGAIAEFATWFGDPAWSVADARLPGVAGLAIAYAALAAAWLWLRSVGGRVRGLGLRSSRSPARRRRPLRVAALAAALLGAMALWNAFHVGGHGAAVERGLLIRVLDVGQGDAILLSPPDGDPVLVDGGPPDGDLPRRLRDLGVRRLAAAVATHDQADHVGGLRLLPGTVPVGAFVHAGPAPALQGDARRAGAQWKAVAAGDRIRSGSLGLRVLWPPAKSTGGSAGEDPNARAIVLLAEHAGFRALLTSDAEAELADLHPGPVDVLKVAHHGSGDTGLAALLSESRPRLGLISVGRDNPYGHPARATLVALEDAGTPVLRTDRDGTITLRVTKGGWTVATAH
jgi:competence protein ComEC